ncbi:hypothetical protein SVAN01_03279 [Stagonosporopsis vannaccii]|nr:hypothetical protein SVAN01_03279 [Stagonosporopsis vannaccii]
MTSFTSFGDDNFMTQMLAYGHLEAFPEPFNPSVLNSGPFSGVEQLEEEGTSLIVYPPSSGFSLDPPRYFHDPVPQHDSQEPNQLAGVDYMKPMSFPNGLRFPQAFEYSHQGPVDYTHHILPATLQQRPSLDTVNLSQPLTSDPVSARTNGWPFDNLDIINTHGIQAIPATSQQAIPNAHASFDANSYISSELGSLQQMTVDPASQDTAALQGLARKAPTAAKSTSLKSKNKSDPKREKKFVRRGKSKYPEIAKVLGKLQRAADILNERSDLEPATYPHLPARNGLFFTNTQEAESVNKITYWEPPANDNTIPTTQAEREAWVVKLLVAIRNNEGCLKTNNDKDSSAFVRRWGNDAGYYSTTALEATAWKLEQLGLDVHQQGWLDAIPEPKLREDIYYSMCFTFEERMNLVIKVLEISKPTCEDLLKGNRFHEIVGCPQVVFERVIGNNKSNNHKSKLLSQHKTQKKVFEKAEKLEKRKRPAEDAGDTEDGSKLGELDEPSLLAGHRKKQKSNARSAPANDADDAGNIASDLDSNVDASHQTNDEFEAQSEACAAGTAVKPTPLPGPSTTIPITAQPLFKETLKCSGSKRSIEDIADGAESSVPVAKKAKAGPRAKATVKDEGRARTKAKAKAVSAAAEDDSEYEQPPHSNSNAIAKPVSSSQAARPARFSTRRKALIAPTAAPASGIASISDPPSCI